MRSSYDFNVNDRKYHVVKFSGTRGLRLLIKLARTIGPAAVVLFQDENAEINGKLVSSVIASLIDAGDEDVFENLVKDLLESCEIYSDTGHRKIEFDIDFAGRYSDLLVVLKEIVRFQYEDFLGGLAKAGEFIQLANQKPTIKAMTS